jgi:hypothetical protein
MAKGEEKSISESDEPSLEGFKYGVVKISLEACPE